VWRGEVAGGGQHRPMKCSRSNNDKYAWVRHSRGGRRGSPARHVTQGTAGEVDRDIGGWWALPPAAHTRKRARASVLVVFSPSLVNRNWSALCRGQKQRHPRAQRGTRHGGWRGGGGPRCRRGRALPPAARTRKGSPTRMPALLCWRRGGVAFNTSVSGEGQRGRVYL